MVDGVTKLGHIKYRGAENKAENLRKMVLALSQDLRVVFIKLADRLHNMQTLDALPPAKQKRIAVETDGGADKKTQEPTRNTLYVFDYDGLTVAHLGDLKQLPPQTEIEALGAVNVALVPVGGGGGLNAAKAAEVISLLEPNIVIPMHYATSDVKVSLESLNKFIKEMGLSKPETQPSIKVTRSSLPEETHVVVLDYQRE